MSSKIPDATVEEILRRSDVASVLGRYLQLRKSGRKFVALCPFHPEKTPSFHVDPDKGLWHCFGCKEGGSVFQFLMKIEGLNFREAALKLAARSSSERRQRVRQGRRWRPVCPGLFV